MGQPNLGSESHVFDFRPIPHREAPKRDFGDPAASPLAYTVGHTPRRAARSPILKHAEERAKVWSREHEVRGRARACRERLFALCAKKRICAPSPARSSRAHTSPLGSVLSYSPKRTRSHALTLRAKIGGRSGALGARPNHSDAGDDPHVVKSRVTARVEPRRAEQVRRVVRAQKANVAPNIEIYHRRKRGSELLAHTFSLVMCESTRHVLGDHWRAGRRSICWLLVRGENEIIEARDTATPTCGTPHTASTALSVLLEKLPCQAVCVT